MKRSARRIKLRWFRKIPSMRSAISPRYRTKRILRKKMGRGKLRWKRRRPMQRRMLRTFLWKMRKKKIKRETLQLLKVRTWQDSNKISNCHSKMRQIYSKMSSRRECRNKRNKRMLRLKIKKIISKLLRKIQ